MFSNVFNKGRSKHKMERVPSNGSMVSIQDIRRRTSIESSLSDSNEIDGAHNLEYQETLMYGRYSANLAEYARQEAGRLRSDSHQQDEIFLSKELQPYRGKTARAAISFIKPLWDHTFARLGEDWVFLFILGTVMATLSFLIDYVIIICFNSRMYLHSYLGNIHWAVQVFTWVAIPTVLVVFAAAFCQWLAPSAAGSGIPEMKTVLRGVVLKEYLTWKTLVAKIVGLAAVIGASMPLGKEGPVMHMASIIATMLTKMLRYIKGSTVDNEARSTDLLAAASTMGVAVCYAAPIGGVLFSIEVTTVYFAVRNYWRGFFAAAVGAMLYRLMAVWFLNEDTIYPLFKVVHNFVYPYDVIELLPFLCIGIVCGFAGSLFVYLHRRYVMLMRHNKWLTKFLQKKRLLYPTFVAISISIVTFPQVLGRFMASTLLPKEQILQLFGNITWTVTNSEGQESLEQSSILIHWRTSPNESFHIGLFVFQIITVFQIGIASTLPVPSGLLIPLFKVGAAFGRQIGELMVSLYPMGIAHGYPIVPGAYAMVGAASFCAAITHTISISVIVFELTGQITYVIPIMMGVLISNCISSLLQPSIYDSVIRIKKLPYLPDIIATTSDVYNIYVEDIMVHNVTYIWYGITFIDLKKILKENRKLKYLPLVDKHDSMILLGSIQRIELVRLLVEQISPEKRRKEATRRHLEALKKKWEDEDREGPKQSKIRYEDEVNNSSDEADNNTSNSVINRFSRTLSRSLSRSRSVSRSRSQSRSRNISPSSDSDGSETPPESLISDRFVDRVSIPPSSPAKPHLKDLFPSKSPLARNKSRFSVKKLDNKDKDKDDKSNDDSNSRDTNLNTSSDITQTTALSAPSTGKLSKKRTTLDLLKDTSSKLRGNAKKKEINAAGDPLANIKRRVKLKRSNSLDSLSIRPKSSLGNLTAPEISVPDSKIVEEEPTPVKKGILKRRNSFSLGTTRDLLAPQQDTVYQTITVGDTKLKNAIERMRKVRLEAGTSMDFKLSQISLFKSKKKEQAKKQPQLDLTDEEKEIWELQELSKEVEFVEENIDPAPFQLVERTSLLRVHSLFSLLGVNHAYVTTIGRLIGVVALKEVRNAIDGQYKANPRRSSPQGTGTSTPNMTPLRSSLDSATSPQRLGGKQPINMGYDAESGTVIKRNITSPLANYSNGVAHS